jgi:hypothetical protein
MDNLIIKTIGSITSTNYMVNEIHEDNERNLQFSFDTYVMFPYHAEYKSITLAANTSPETTEFFKSVEDRIKQVTKIEHFRHIKSFTNPATLETYKEIAAKVKNVSCLNKRSEAVPIVSYKKFDRVNVTLECNGLWKIRKEYFLSWNLVAIKNIE